jgi:hypothetical protein
MRVKIRSDLYLIVLVLALLISSFFEGSRVLPAGALLANQTDSSETEVSDIIKTAMFHLNQSLDSLQNGNFTAASSKIKEANRELMQVSTILGNASIDESRLSKFGVLPPLKQ